jgi:hypothetical protein
VNGSRDWKELVSFMGAIAYDHELEDRCGCIASTEAGARKVRDSCFQPILLLLAS